MRWLIPAAAAVLSGCAVSFGDGDARVEMTTECGRGMVVSNDLVGGVNCTSRFDPPVTVSAFVP